MFSSELRIERLNPGCEIKVSDYEKVKAFHKKFNVPTDEGSAGPALPGSDVLAYRADFLQEELDEFVDSYLDQDLEGATDALLDLVYVAYGTALLMGISPLAWQELFDDVQRANMAKERATSADDPRSKRKHSLDVVKPEGWVGPRGADILRKHGAKI